MDRTVVPSVWYEVFGLVILEAFACGKPVVAGNIGALSEIVDDGKTGLLYNAGDTEDLVKKVKWMYDNPESAKKMGLNAQKIAAQRYSPDKYLKELMRTHHELITDA